MTFSLYPPFDPYKITYGPPESMILPGGVVDNMLALHTVNPGSILGRGIHSDLDDHYNGGPVSLDHQWHVKEPWRR